MKAQSPYFEALWQSPFFVDGDLVLPSDLSWTDFGIIHQFLFSKDYPPSVSATLRGTAAASQATSSLASRRVNGPPYMLPPSSGAPPFVLRSVQAYNLGNFLNFEPLASHALQRLDSLPFTFENPTVVLENIYQPHSETAPSDEIRRWVRSWLSRPFLTLFGAHAETYKTNLGVLEQHADCAGHFMQLQCQSDHLAEDAAIVRINNPVSRGPVEFQTGPTISDINWLNERTFTPQPLFAGQNGAGTYLGAPGHPAFANIPSSLSTETPWYPSAGSSWASGSTLGDEAVDQLRRMKLGV